jgi:hypothetical protein
VAAVTLFSNALSGDIDALQGVAALVSIAAIIPSAVVFVISQLLGISLMRQENHKYLHGLYNEFLLLVLEHPELGIGWNERAKKRLSAAQRAQRDTAFDYLTALFETAFLTYRARLRSARASQWRGWEEYIAHYAARDDYLEWWDRVILGSDPGLRALRPRDAHRPIVTQYDARFEAYMLGLVEPGLTRLFQPDVAPVPAEP